MLDKCIIGIKIIDFYLLKRSLLVFLLFWFIMMSLGLLEIFRFWEKGVKFGKVKREDEEKGRDIEVGLEEKYWGFSLNRGIRSMEGYDRIRE